MPEEKIASEGAEQEPAAKDSVNHGTGSGVDENTSASMLEGLPLQLSSPTKKRRRRGSLIESFIASSPVRTGSSGSVGSGVGSGVDDDVNSLVALSPLRSYDSFPDDDDVRKILAFFGRYYFSF